MALAVRCTKSRAVDSDLAGCVRDCPFFCWCPKAAQGICGLLRYVEHYWGGNNSRNIADLVGRPIGTAVYTHRIRVDYGRVFCGNKNGEPGQYASGMAVHDVGAQVRIDPRGSQSSWMAHGLLWICEDAGDHSTIKPAHGHGIATVPMQQCADNESQQCPVGFFLAGHCRAIVGSVDSYPPLFSRPFGGG